MRALILLMIPAAAWSQGPAQPAGGGKPSRAEAYYHYTLAHMYAEMAATSSGGNRAYLEKAIENHRIAVEADPRTPPLRVHHSRRFVPAAPRPEREQPNQRGEPKKP